MISIKNIGVFSKFSKSLNSQCLLTKSVFNTNPVISSSLTLKAFRDPDYSRPPPFSYETQSYLFTTPLFDKGLKRFDENTKFIVVEGNIGVGKTRVAKKIAEAFDLKYFPEVTMDAKYINHYGYDLRDMDPYLSERLQSVDIERFYTTPYHKAVPRLQIEMYRYRFYQYINALNHLLNSGQGVVLERSHFSDFVFAKTMLKFNYIRKDLLQYYMDIRENTADELYAPHLVLYLDAPVDVLMERIKQRNIPYEVNSKVLDKEYLETLDQYYKEYLENAKVKSDVKILDWTKPQDLDLLMLDIEKINFDRFVRMDSQLLQWRELIQTNERNLREYRRFLTVKMPNLVDKLYPPTYNINEIYFSVEEMLEYAEVVKKMPGENYAPGFNPEMGESVLFKYEKRDYKIDRYLFTRPKEI